MRELQSNSWSHYILQPCKDEKCNSCTHISAVAENKMYVRWSYMSWACYIPLLHMWPKCYIGHSNIDNIIRKTSCEFTNMLNERRNNERFNSEFAHLQIGSFLLSIKAFSKYKKLKNTCQHYYYYCILLQLCL